MPTAIDAVLLRSEFVKGYKRQPDADANAYHIPSHPPTRTHFKQMQAIRLQKKYPEISQDEMFNLINRFK